jgi:hypothetical protein
MVIVIDWDVVCLLPMVRVGSVSELFLGEISQLFGRQCLSESLNAHKSLIWVQWGPQNTSH